MLIVIVAFCFFFGCREVGCTSDYLVLRRAVRVPAEDSDVAKRTRYRALSLHKLFVRICADFVRHEFVSNCLISTLNLNALLHAMAQSSALP